MSTDAREGRLRVRDVELEYSWHGPDAGRPFVLVHGFTGSRDDWTEHLPALGALGPTLAIDQRGHGGSTNTGDAGSYTLDTLVLDLEAALTALGVETLDLLGHSMGGMVALRFALAYPERVASLVLMDTSDGPVELGPPGILERMAELARGAGMAGLFAAMRARAKDDPARPEAARRCEEKMGSERFWGRIEAKLGAMDPEAFVGLGDGLVSHASARDRLGEIRCPALVIVGEQDRAFLEPSDAMSRGIPDAVQVVVPEAAHSPQLENPGPWFDAIRAHLERARA